MKKVDVIGKCINTPIARFVSVGNNYKMFHESIDNEEGSTPYKTPGCNNVDASGMCCGHNMSREDFITQYCNGVTPAEKNQNSKGAACITK